MTKRAVLYAQVSSDDTRNDGRNLDSQLEMCRDFADQQGWEMIDVVVAREIDRFSRRLAKQLIIVSLSIGLRAKPAAREAARTRVDCGPRSHPGYHGAPDSPVRL